MACRLLGPALRRRWQPRATRKQPPTPSRNSTARHSAAAAAAFRGPHRHWQEPAGAQPKPELAGRSAGVGKREAGMHQPVTVLKFTSPWGLGRDAVEASQVGFLPAARLGFTLPD